jgi:hypothetical protein
MVIKQERIAIGALILNDAPPTPWKTQMWVQVKDSGRKRSRDTFPSSQHLKGRGACWSSGMGLGRIDKLIHSPGPAHNPHKWLVHSWSTFGAKTSHGQHGHTRLTTARTWGSHHLPPYSILCASPRGLHPNGFSLPGLPRGSPEIPPVGIPGTLRAHNFLCKAPIAMRSKAKL